MCAYGFSAMVKIRKLGLGSREFVSELVSIAFGRILTGFGHGHIVDLSHASTSSIWTFIPRISAARARVFSVTD